MGTPSHNSKSPKSARRSERLSIFSKTPAPTPTTGKRKSNSISNPNDNTPSKRLAAAFDQCAVSSTTAIPGQQLTAMFDQYEPFLHNKKSAGKGWMTRFKVKNRDLQISQITNIFKYLREEQTIENWKELLTLLAKYRFEIKSPTSTFRDALWAIQKDILNKIAKAHKANPNCTVLRKLVEYKHDVTLCYAEKEDDTSSMRAAFDHLTAFQQYPQLTVYSERVMQFIAELNSMDSANSINTTSIYSGNDQSIIWQRGGEKNPKPLHSLNKASLPVSIS